MEKFKKYLVLGILFFLPISVYIFFASGKDNFARLPVLTPSVMELEGATTLDGEPVLLKDNITILGFFGEDPMQQKVSAYNLAHKIYKKNHGFEDFQLVVLIPEEATETARELKATIAQIADTEKWKFAVTSSETIAAVFRSLETQYELQPDLSSDYVFIIDKDRNLRGRDDDEDAGVLYGFKAQDIAEVNNKMSDDVKVLLAEYRLALKKYKADRKI
jgi:hypothetical protein